MLATGDVLENRFEIEDVERRTEAFTLYRARDRDKKRSVVIREMPVTSRERERAVKQFLAEAQARMKLKHVSLPEVYAAFTHEGYVYVANEDVEGPTLKEVIAEGMPDEGQVLRWASELIRLLEHASSRSQVTIRELRPANIVVSPDGLKVTDIGLSRILRGAAAGSRKGSRADIRALGGCLYEALTGIPAPELSERPIAGELFRRVNLVNPDVSEEVGDAVERMVDPLSEPFKSMDEVKLYLGLAGQPIPRREKREKERSKDLLFDPERIDPVEERAALRTLVMIVVGVGLFLWCVIEWQGFRNRQLNPNTLLVGPPVAAHRGPLKWTPASMALKEYLDDLSGFGRYEAIAVGWHSRMLRKHQVQAANNAEFEIVLSKKVIPYYQRFVDNLRVIVTPNDEIRVTHAYYVQGARLLLTGYKEQRKALHAGDMRALDEANRYITQGNLQIGQWTTHVRLLERKYGVYASETGGR